MKKLLYISIFAAFLGCKDDEVIRGTAVSFYPKLVDAITEGGSTSASLELTGPGTGTVTIRVSDPQFITTTPAMTDGTLQIVFDGDDSETIDISVARGGRSDDYTVDFDVVAVSGDIEDIAKGTFRLFVNTIPSLQLPFLDDFESCSEEFATPELWIEEFVGDSKTDRGWGCRATDGFAGTRGVRASAFGGETGTDHSWLITNGSLDLSTVSEVYMTFDIKSNFSGDGDLFVKWSEDYSGAGDPTVATWTEVPGVASQLPAQGSGSYKKVAADISTLIGKKIFIGFQYVGASSTSSASFEMDNISISNDGSAFEFFQLPFADDLNLCSDFSIPANFIQEIVPGSKLDRGWECSSNGVSGSQAVSVSALGGVSGTADAWLISTKAFDLESVTVGTLSFDIKSSVAGSGELNILWSEDYSGTGNPSNATWTEFSGFTLPSGGSNAYTNVEVDIIDAVGTTSFFAFQFVGGTNTSSISYDLDNINVASTTGGSGGSFDTDAGDCDLTGAGTIIVSHDFEGCTADFSTPDGFIEEFVPGSKTDRGWGCRADGTSGSRAVRASAFGGEEGYDDAWLIMDAINANSYSEISLKFDVQSVFDGPGDLSVLYSSDYSGSGDPSNATWIELDNVSDQLPAKGASEFATVTTSPCDLSGSSVYIAFRYYNGTSSASSAWSIDNLELRGN